ncbi:MAG: pyruvate formate lyase family protein [Planctomycetota bacterium]|jgi:formate C-acetyltransferase
MRSLRELILSYRDRLLATADTVCLERAYLITEGYRLYEHEPVIICRAKALAHVLANMTLELKSNPVFAGNTSSRLRAWMLLPEYGFVVPEQADYEDESLIGFLDGDAVPDELRSFWSSRAVGCAGGIGHLAVDYSRVLSEGLESIIAEAEGYPENGDPASVDFRRACVISCRAVVRWAHRYAEAAGQEAEQCDCPTTKALLRRVADACRRVPQKGARTFFEALQCIVLLHLAMHIEGHGYSVSLGRLDRVLSGYYEVGFSDEATELLAGFMLKIYANSAFGSNSKTQCITLGGCDSSGSDCCNQLTGHFLEACDMLRVPDPPIFLRWHENIDPAIKNRALQLLSTGLSMPMLVGDTATVQGLVNAGIAAEDAWNYCVIGCNELGIPGKLCDSASGPTINDAQILNDALGGLESVSAVSGMSDLFEAIGESMRIHIRRALTEYMQLHQAMSAKAPTPFTSALMDGCLARGRDLLVEGQYNLPGLYEVGFTNAVNGLAAIEHVVFQQGNIALDELIAALSNDFSDENIRRVLLACPKWGNDDDVVDRWALWWLAMREEAKADVDRELGSRGHVCVHVIRSLNRVESSKTGASPDGRRGGEPLADSIGAQRGTAFEGPTALLNSVLKLEPSRYWQGGYNLNLQVGRVVAGESTCRHSLIAMIDAFFADGGQELQVHCIDAATLRDARDHPERYQDLLVRIAGYNAIFVRLPVAVQEELIERADNSHYRRL